MEEDMVKKRSGGGSGDGDKTTAVDFPGTWTASRGLIQRAGK
jgi:hypothetical protein